MPSNLIERLVLVLGAGASRAVSYAHETDYPSPLDSDFFDLLQRRRVTQDFDARLQAIDKVLNRVRALPAEYWRSMERAFYTLHLRVFLAKKLGHALGDSDEALIGDFATSIQALLRSAHEKNVCSHHEAILSKIGNRDTIITFNYDLVAERALRHKCVSAKKPFGDWLYGVAKKGANRGPILLKLHGSSNWKLVGENFTVRTQDWNDFDDAPGYRGDKGEGTVYPIFLPFWDKRIERNPWMRLWTRAYRKLTRAKQLVVWGYSLPQTDIKAQQLFSLALAEKEGLKLCVIDPASATRARWRDMFRNALYWEYNRVEDFLEHPPGWWASKDA